jgi:hypothetical protein
MTARGKRRFSASDWLFGLAMLFAVAIHLPALFAPLTVDDFGQRAMTHGSYPPGDRGPFSLYDFVDDTNRQELVDRGIFPWWTHPHMVARFLRPLSSLSLYLDYRIGPDTAFRGHAENFLWWVAASACVYLLAARLFDRRVARLACFAFTACPCHAIPLIWVANRDTFISQVLGIAGLLGYVAWRRRGRVRDGAVSLALFALAMAAGEYSFCFAGYIRCRVGSSACCPSGFRPPDISLRALRSTTARARAGCTSIRSGTLDGSSAARSSASRCCSAPAGSARAFSRSSRLRRSSSRSRWPSRRR